MALLLLDGFDLHDTAADLQRRYSVGNTSFIQPATASGRFGGGCVELQASASEYVLSAGFAASATAILGFALQLAPQASGGAAGVDEFLTLLDSGGTAQLALAVDTATMLLKAYRGTTTGGTLLATGATPLQTSVWYQIEIKCTVDDTTGVFKLRLNGSTTEEINFSGDTRNAGVANVATFQFTAVYVGSNNCFTVRIDDLYVLDTTGPYNNDFLGDVRVSTLQPSADTAQKDFSRPTGGSNYALVDETLSDNADTDYVESSTVGHKDLYELSDLPAGAQGVKAVQVASVARKDDAGARSARAVLKSGPTTSNGSTVALSTSYALGLDLREADPNTSAAWGVAAVNALQAGYEVVS